jgi:hypothetical protein
VREKSKNSMSIIRTRSQDRLDQQAEEEALLAAA